MIKLDYRTNNARWGLTGLRYSSWIDYAFSLGYLSNIEHYHNVYDGLIELHVEGNEQQGAWNKEGRIHYYGTDSYLISYLSDWDACKSAGRGSITCRINSNDYIYSLIDDYDFVVRSYPNKTTWDVFPPQNDAHDHVLSLLLNSVARRNAPLQDLEDAFNDGWSMV